MKVNVIGSSCPNRVTIGAKVGSSTSDVAMQDANLSSSNVTSFQSSPFGDSIRRKVRPSGVGCRPVRTRAFAQGYPWLLNLGRILKLDHEGFTPKRILSVVDNEEKFVVMVP